MYRLENSPRINWEESVHQQLSRHDNLWETHIREKVTKLMTAAMRLMVVEAKVECSTSKRELSMSMTRESVVIKSAVSKYVSSQCELQDKPGRRVMRKLTECTKAKELKPDHTGVVSNYRMQEKVKNR